MLGCRASSIGFNLCAIFAVSLGRIVWVKNGVVFVDHAWLLGAASPLNFRLLVVTVAPSCVHPFGGYLLVGISGNQSDDMGSNPNHAVCFWPVREA